MNNLGYTLGSRWQEFNWLMAICIFVAYFILDIMYVKYTLAVVARKAAQAANIGGLMYTLMAFGIFNYTHNFLYVIPVGLGSWLGTYVVVKRESKKAT